MLLSSSAYALWPQLVSPLWAGVFSWLAAIILSYRLSPRQRRPIGWLLILGILGCILGGYYHHAPSAEQLLASNQSMMSMLLAVTFLRLVANPGACSHDTPLPRGPRALWQTLFGVHLFGAVINMSTIFILGDRIATRGRLGKRRALALSRGFSIAAFWSPFFAAMATAITYAPGAKVSQLIIWGIPLALLALWLTGRELSENSALRGAPFIGYPLDWHGLWLPGLLVVLVLLSQKFTTLSVLNVIIITSPLVTLVVLLARDGLAGIKPLIRHIEHGLCESSNELSLFLAAGLLSAGLSSALAAFGHWTPFSSFGPIQAVLLLLIMLGLALLGLHPVATIATFGTWMAPLNPDPTLLAMVFLYSWGLGVNINPLSGVHLAMQGRYGIEGYAFLRWNLPYYLPRVIAAAMLILLAYGWLHS